MPTNNLLRDATRLWRLVLAVVWMSCALTATPAAAQDDPPGRVGRIADLNGGVSWFDADQGQWTPAERNRPLTGSDRIATARDGRAELRVGSTTLRLGNSSELEVLQLDDQRLVFQLHGGSLAVRVRSADVAGEIELVTAEARLQPLRAGLYRIDRIDDTTQAGAWRGELRVDGPTGLVVAAGQRVELQRGDRPTAAVPARPAWGRVPSDGFSAWVLAEESGDERTVAARYVSAEMTGVEDLDRAGRWEQHPEYGAVWTPLAVEPDWAPYRYGRWAWVQPWGWTWVDDARWGFAPFHYGRWAYWRSSWCWVPGAYVARPVFAPALVAWVGGSAPGRPGAGWGATLRIGGPGAGPGRSVGWTPLAPREGYRPAYRHTPGYGQRINPGPPYRWQQPPGDGPHRSAPHFNEGVRNGVTTVPGDVLLRRQPVARAAIEVRGGDGRDSRDRDVRDARDPGDQRGPHRTGEERDRRHAGEERIGSDRSDGPRRGDRNDDDRGAGSSRTAPGVGSALPQPPFQPQPQAPLSATRPPAGATGIGPPSPSAPAPVPPSVTAPAPAMAPSRGLLPSPDRPMPSRNEGRPAVPALPAAPAVPVAPAVPAATPDAIQRPQQDRSMQQQQRRDRSDRGEGAQRDERPRQPRELPSPVAAERMGQPPPSAQPPSAAPTSVVGPQRPAAASPPPPAPPAAPAAVQAPRPAEAREPREQRQPPRPDGEQRSRRQDGPSPPREREGGR